MKFDSMRAWNDGVAMLKANRDMLAPLAGVFILLPGLALLHFFPGPEPKSGADWETIAAAMRGYFAENWLPILLAAIVTSIGSLSIVALLIQRDRPTVSGAISHGLRALPVLIAAQILFGAVVVLGGGLIVGLAGATGVMPLAMLAVLLVCGFAAYAFIRLILLSPVVVSLPGVSPVGALRRAAMLTRGSFWNLLAFFLLVTVAAMIVTGLVDGGFRALFALVLEGEAAGFADSVVTSVTQTAASVLNIALVCSAYRQLSGDLERTTAAFE